MRIETMFLILLITAALVGSASAVRIGNNSYGYVEKIYYGNQSSNETIAIITGVHPRESGIHKAVNYQLENTSLQKKYVLYRYMSHVMQ
ncbi:hypothetical protein [Methanothermobacter sp.]|uniref:hypothetical protein n=1 Tax=Methanothermobacter sp. TaxID=1884223 RepID=UPI003C728058